MYQIISSHDKLQPNPKVNVLSNHFDVVGLSCAKMWHCLKGYVLSNHFNVDGVLRYLKIWTPDGCLNKLTFMYVPKYGLILKYLSCQVILLQASC